jgi:hypothetical protein
MKQIAQALVKAQQAFAPALKTNANPFFKSKYADLTVCIEAVIDALHTNGIALIQRNHDCADGVKVETILLHESGEEFSGGVLHVPALKSDPQAYGSALTYARRYSLMATCGIAPEDDDGNAAKAPNQAPAKVSPAPNLKPPPLNEKEQAECIAAMNGCTDLDALKGIFGGAYTRASDIQKRTLTDVYNAKKSLLEKAA